MPRYAPLLTLLLLIGIHPVNAQFTPWDIIYCINGGENKTVVVNPSGPGNPVEKPGWNLLFHDEFDSDTLNPVYWNRSNPWDDGIGGCFRNFSVNSNNIAVSGGMVQISNTGIPAIPDCPFSGGEIKSMSVRDTGFGSYYFYAPGYVEARVRLFNKTGQGASFWLWGIGSPENPGGPGPWSEIDIFELNGNSQNAFNGTYHWTSNGKHVSQNHSVFLYDAAGKYDLSVNWTIFGLEWDSTFIRWYVNNTLVKELDLAGIPPYCIDALNYIIPSAPYCVRLTTSHNTVGNQSVLADPGDFPQTMSVDYLRVYRRQGVKKTPLVVHDSTRQICGDEASFDTVTRSIGSYFYPGFQYEWNSPGFDIIPRPEQMPQPAERYKIKIRKESLPGEEYPLHLNSTDPWGHHESDTARIYIAPGIPPEHSSPFIPSQISDSCYYKLKTEVSKHSLQCEYSTGNGITWKTAGMVREAGMTFAQFGRFRPDTGIAIRFRTRNSCGISNSVQTTITLPPALPDCKWPLGISNNPESNDRTQTPAIVLMPNPVDHILHVHVSQPGRSGAGQLIRVTDLLGTVMLESWFTEDNTDLDLSGLKSGLFFVSLHIPDKPPVYSRFIKN